MSRSKINIKQVNKLSVVEEIKALREENARLKKELEDEEWASKKTNEGIKALYKELEKKNEELKKFDQLKSDFISTVSHELRTPLSITKEGISLVLDRIPGEINEKQSQILGMAKDNIDRLARIIDDMLDISKIEEGGVELRKELIDITSVIKQVVSSFEPVVKKKGLELKVNLPKEGIDIYADADRITQVFTNLMGNAIKFTEEGYIEISAAEKEDEVECFVADTGMGIARYDLPEVFTKFRQFRRVVGPGERGTGLGLSIAKGIVEMHKGKIWCESELGKGTKFILTLPKYTAEAMFKEYVNKGIKEAMEKDSKMSLIVVSIAGFDKLIQKMPIRQIGSILKDMETVLKNALRRKGDVVAKNTGEVIVILADCNKESALRVESRLKEVLKDYLAREKMIDNIKLQFGCTTYPDEAVSDEELIKKAKKIE